MSGTRHSRFQGGLEEMTSRGRSGRRHHHHHHHHPQQQQQQRLRNPWVAHESQSTSSSSGRTHRGAVGPSEVPLRPIRPHLHLASSSVHGDPLLSHYPQPTFYGLPDVPGTLHIPIIPSAPDRPRDLLLPHPSIPRPAVVIPAAAPASAAPGESSSTGSRVGAGSSACTGRGGRDDAAEWETTGGWSGGGCGGRCSALDDFCFQCLRVAFVLGIVGGIALVVTGAVLHESRFVFVYIGGLTAVVSMMLLGVHCCVRRDHVRRKRRLRERQRRPSGGGTGSRRGSRGAAEECEDGIPLREMGPTIQAHPVQPQTISQGAPRGTAQPIAYHGLVLNPPPPPAAFRSNIAGEITTDGCTDDLEIVSQVGKSLWKKKDRQKAEIVESHH